MQERFGGVSRPSRPRLISAGQAGGGWMGWDGSSGPRDRGRPAVTCDDDAGTAGTAIPVERHDFGLGNGFDGRAVARPGVKEVGALIALGLHAVGEADVGRTD